MNRSETWEQLSDEHGPQVEVLASTGDRPVVVVAVGEFDDADGELSKALAQAVQDGDGRVVVDMLGVTFINSAVVRALLLAQAETIRCGGWLRLAWTSHIIGRVLDICGLAELFPRHTTVAAAVENRPVDARREEPPT